MLNSVFSKDKLYFLLLLSFSADTSPLSATLVSEFPTLTLSLSAVVLLHPTNVITANIKQINKHNDFFI